ncbi:DEBR0S1_09934g1_1 [Brettanomyces bruxellensis]|uniref:DEBR0S1_09934g1_1 n=1 Tax=Dekkera bruxellensis TaxID=5007 RepID=A0A7D9GX58_DEKBR|nr:DEBR0S1_09934g1_1 [Brettanomyces bruxellensis]
MALTEKILIKVLDWGFCLLPLLSIYHLTKCNNSSYKEVCGKFLQQFLMLLPTVLVFMASVTCMIYNFAAFKNLSDVLASFVQFILYGYTLLRQYMLLRVVPKETQSTESFLLDPQMMSQINSTGVISNTARGVQLSPKTVASDTMIFNIDSPELDENPFSRCLQSHAPVLAALLAVTPVSSNAFPLTTIVPPAEPSAVELLLRVQYFGTIMENLNFLFLISGKILQICQFYVTSNLTLTQSFKFFALEAIFMLLFILFKGSLLPFHYVWQLTTILGLDFALSIISLTKSESLTPGGEGATLAGKLRARLLGYKQHTADNSFAAHNSRGVIDQDYGTINCSG